MNYKLIQTKTMRQVFVSSLMFAVFPILLPSCSSRKESTTNSVSTSSVQLGDMSHQGGTPTIRVSFEHQLDDPGTSSDESNDQRLGHFGTATIYAHSEESGNTYTLDADVNGNEVQRVYFPKGGWVDFNTSEIDSDGNGSGTDEQGGEWGFEGYVASNAIKAIAPESNDGQQTEIAETESEDSTQ